MKHSQLEKALRELSGIEFEKIVGELLRAEGRSIGAPVDSQQSRAEEGIQDGGIDIYVDASAAEFSDSEVFESGKQYLLQVKTKSGNPKPVASDHAFKAEIKKEEVIRRILEGCVYIYVVNLPMTPVYHNDLLNVLKDTIKQEVLQNAPDTAAQTKVHIWNLNTVARMITRYPGILQSFHLAAFEGGVTVENALAGIDATEQSYEEDETRKSVRKAVAGINPEEASRTAFVLQVVGRPYVGTTRTVLESIKQTGQQQFTLYVRGAQLSQRLHNDLCTHREAGILIIDNASSEQLQELLETLKGAATRWQLIAIQRGGKDFPQIAKNNVRIAPLDEEACTAIAKSYTELSDGDIRNVAKLMHGYPRWVHELARELSCHDWRRTLPYASRELLPMDLANLLPDTNVRLALTALSFFSPVDFKKEHLQKSTELQNEIASRFGLQSTVLVQLWDEAADAGDFVEIGGGYIKVVPVALRTSMMLDHIRNSPGFLRSLMNVDSQTLWRKSLDQFIWMASAGARLRSELKSAAAKIQMPALMRPAHQKDSEIATTTESLRALRKMTHLIPADVLKIVETWVAKSALGAVYGSGKYRRDLVWMLEILKWFPETWKESTTMLWELALEESEPRYGNNTTNEFQATFSRWNPGTCATGTERMQFLEDLTNNASGAVAAGLLAGAVTNVWLRGGVTASRSSAPRSWRAALPPGNIAGAANEKELQIRALKVWECLFDQANPNTRLILLDGLLRNWDVLPRLGLGNAVLNIIPNLDLGAAEKVVLLKRIWRHQRYENIHLEILEQMEQLLLAGTLESRLQLLVCTELWDLPENAQTGKSADVVWSPFQKDLDELVACTLEEKQRLFDVIGTHRPVEMVDEVCYEVLCYLRRAGVPAEDIQELAIAAQSKAGFKFATKEMLSAGACTTNDVWKILPRMKNLSIFEIAEAFQPSVEMLQDLFDKYPQDEDALTNVEFGAKDRLLRGYWRKTRNLALTELVAVTEFVDGELWECGLVESRLDFIHMTLSALGSDGRIKKAGQHGRHNELRVLGDIAARALMDGLDAGVDEEEWDFAMARILETGLIDLGSIEVLWENRKASGGKDGPYPEFDAMLYSKISAHSGPRVLDVLTEEICGPYEKTSLSATITVTAGSLNEASSADLWDNQLQQLSDSALWDVLTNLEWSANEPPEELLVVLTNSTAAYFPELVASNFICEESYVLMQTYELKNDLTRAEKWRDILKQAGHPRLMTDTLKRLEARIEDAEYADKRREMRYDL